MASAGTSAGATATARASLNTSVSRGSSARFRSSSIAAAPRPIRATLARPSSSPPGPTCSVMPAGGADDDVGVEPRAAGAAGVLGDERQREAPLFQRAPELVGPRALLGGLDQLLGGQVGEEPRDGVAEQ